MSTTRLSGRDAINIFADEESRDITISGRNATTGEAGMVQKASFPDPDFEYINNRLITPLEARLVLYKWGIVDPPNEPLFVRNLPLGAEIKIQENDIWTNFTIVQKNSPAPMYINFEDSITVMRSIALPPRRMHGSENNDYANSELRAWLDNATTGYLSTIQSGIRNLIKQVRIPFRAGNGNSVIISSGNNGLLTHVFLPSRTEGNTIGQISYQPNPIGVPFSLPFIPRRFDSSSMWSRTPWVNWHDTAIRPYGLYGSPNALSSSTNPCSPAPCLVLPNTVSILPIPDDDGAFFVQV